MVVEAEVKAVGIGDQGCIKAPDVKSHLDIPSTLPRTSRAQTHKTDIELAFVVMIVLMVWPHRIDNRI